MDTMAIDRDTIDRDTIDRDTIDRDTIDRGTTAIESSVSLESMPDEGNAICSFASLHEPDAALAAARRLYQQQRAGLRFFCENRRVIPVDELDSIDPALLEDGAASQPRVRSTM